MKEKFNSYDPPIECNFPVIGIEDNKINLKRLYPSYCPVCDRVHENQNPFIYINESRIYWNCRRAGRRDGDDITDRRKVLLLGYTKIYSYNDFKAEDHLDGVDESKSEDYLYGEDDSKLEDDFDKPIFSLGTKINKQNFHLVNTQPAPLSNVRPDAGLDSGSNTNARLDIQSNTRSKNGSESVLDSGIQQKLDMESGPKKKIIITLKNKVKNEYPLNNDVEDVMKKMTDYKNEKYKEKVINTKSMNLNFDKSIPVKNTSGPIKLSFDASHTPHASCEKMPEREQMLYFD
jgi:hypothetical protein